MNKSSHRIPSNIQGIVLTKCHLFRGVLDNALRFVEERHLRIDYQLLEVSYVLGRRVVVDAVDERKPQERA